MKIEKFAKEECCGSFGIAFKLEKPITTEIILAITNIGFIENKKFTNVGILYIDDENLSATGAINQNLLQIKCKPKKDCNSSIDKLEKLFNEI